MRILEKWEEEDPENNKVYLIIPNGRDSKSKREEKKRRLYKLRKMAEKAKIELSTSQIAQIDLSEYYGDYEEFILDVEREDFEDCNRELFERTMTITNQLFTESNIPKSRIRQILLIGGSSQIPKIQQMLQEEFPNIPINNSINCNEVVAQGAAMYGKNKMDGQLDIVTEVTAHEILMDSREGRIPIIEKGTELPINREIPVIPYGGYSIIEIFENDNQIGKYTIRDTPYGNEAVYFVINVETDGVLKITGKFANGTEVDVSCNLTKKSGDVKEIQRVQQVIDKYFAN